MMREVTEKELKQLDKDMNAWWSKLDVVTKSQIYNFLKDLNGLEDLRKAIAFQKEKEKKRFWKKR